MEKEDGNKLFDSQIRSILGDAREDVPGHLWHGIERRLSAMESIAGESVTTGPADVKDRRRTVSVPFWTKVAGSVAAAAAVAAVMFLSGTFDGAVSERQYERMAEVSGNIGIIREDGLHDIRMTDVPAPEMLKDMLRPADKAGNEDMSGDTGSGGNETDAAGPVSAADGIPSTEQKEAGDSGDGSNGSNDGNGTAAPAERPVSGDVSEDTGASADTGISKEDAAQWEMLLREEENRQRQGVKTSFTVSGNAISNTNASVSNNSPAIMYSPGRNEPSKDMVTESSESSYAIPVSAGLGVKVDFTRRWSASIGVNYSLLRRTFDGTFYDVRDDGVHTSDFSGIVNRQDYIGVPVNVYFSILKSNIIDFYAYAGGTAEKCVSNVYRMSSDGADINHRESVKGMQFSANAGIGMEFIIADLVGIYIDPSLRYYFPDDRQPRSIRTVQPLMFGVELGFRFHL